MKGLRPVGRGEGAHLVAPMASTECEKVALKELSRGGCGHQMSCERQEAEGEGKSGSFRLSFSTFLDVLRAFSSFFELFHLFPIGSHPREDGRGRPEAPGPGRRLGPDLESRISRGKGVYCCAMSKKPIVHQQARESICFEPLFLQKRGDFHRFLAYFV